MRCPTAARGALTALTLCILSSAALAVSQRHVFISRDFAPMRQLRLSESIMMETTADVLVHLVRRGLVTKQQSERIKREIHAASKPRRRS